ncbi:hypothetical protein AAFF_G00414880 [Aldrovandia affinis]|uniref:Uncharacterized protein n=1 Tax=Aldrovandia affinis TaxID=143900 RepID=A0AAD7SAQ7_9TELE|nr:hypothetical protein AAFF_G00414880 [Aldrovandia affinis]
MDDDEDDVFQPIPRCWNTHFREIKYEDRGTQTPSPAPGQDDNMLPCGVAQEPRRLFYGNAGFRLHFPARFEHGGDQEHEEEELGEAERSEPALSAEVQIGQKLQLIGDQFHQDHLHQYHRNQRNQRPVWWRLAIALYTFLFEREGVAQRQQADQRFLRGTAAKICKETSETSTSFISSDDGLRFATVLYLVLRRL